MQKGKAKKIDFKGRAEGEKKIVCFVCGREMKTDECSWQEDDDGMICNDCLAERENCGCSD